MSEDSPIPISIPVPSSDTQPMSKKSKKSKDDSEPNYLLWGLGAAAVLWFLTRKNDPPRVVGPPGARRQRSEAAPDLATPVLVSSDVSAESVGSPVVDIPGFI